MSDTFTAQREVDNMYNEITGWKQLAHLDAGESYDVDDHYVYEDKDGNIQYVYASGCSCWGGEATIYTFPNLLALAQHFFQNGNVGYYLSDKGAANLLAEAYNNFRV